MAKYNLTVCGGTFDLFHAGHKAFIKKILKHSEKVTLGITSNLYVKSFKNNLGIEDFKVRKKAVEKFLDSIGASRRVKIVEINNAYEPYLETSTDYQAITVTLQTKKVAMEINRKRKQNNVRELKIIVVDMKLAQDGKIISSTRIRNGEINREGRLYVNPKWKNKKLILPENLRFLLQQPWGEVVSRVPAGIDGTKVITIGDVTTLEFNKKNVGQFLSIVDFLVQRQIKFRKLSELGFSNQRVQKVKNSPGTISFDLFEAVRKAFELKTKENVILIDGEEDLSVMPAILLSPLGFNIFYGQSARIAMQSVTGRSNEGLVRIIVDEEKKQRAYKLAESFDKV